MIYVFVRALRAYTKRRILCGETLMKKRTKILSLITAGAIACTVTLAGCSLVTANSQADMEQTIAEVDISKSESLSSDLSAYTGAISSGTSIKKRELVAYFLNSGSELVNNGSTYGEAFATLAESLVNNAILVQYATLATLQQMVEDPDYTAFSTAEAAVEWFNGLESDAARYEALLTYQATVDEYTGEDDVNYVSLTQYSMMLSLNNAIDSYEESNLNIDSSDDTSSATLPDGVDTEVENFYPVNDDGTLDYGVYTGYDGYLLSDSGIYADDAVEGTTKWTRRQAYNTFIQVLDANYLITDEDDVSDVWNLNYVQSDYVSMLKQRMLSNYYTLYENELEQSIEADGYAYVAERYSELLSQQSSDYGTSLSNFETAMGNMSDTSFILYAPDTSDTQNKFGYVYNILLPYSAQQTQQLTALSSLRDNEVITEDEYYQYRNDILKNITTTDQRSAWFNGGVDYSFDATDSGITYYTGGNSDRNILFFENNLLNTDRYESISKYDGRYTYNGIAIKNNDDESYTLIPNTLTIDDMLGEFEGYLEFVLGSDAVSYGYRAADGTFTATDSSAYYSIGNFRVDETDENSEIDYSKFMYAYGKVDLGTFVASDLMNENSSYYKAMSAVNELQYAYTTDTGVLSEYVGYTVGAYTTSYIKEFEYAAQYVCRQGAGSYVVVPSDYGWHIIYCTFSYLREDGASEEDPIVPFVYDDSLKDVEGTFSNLFYEALRADIVQQYQSLAQTNAINAYESCATVYEERYADLSGLDTAN